MNNWVKNASRLFIEHKEHRSHYETKCHEVVPSKLIAQVRHRKNRENHQRDDFLDRFQLRRRKLIGPNAVRGYLKAIFNESDHPADEDCDPQGRLPEPEVAVPSESHEDIGDSQQDDGSHFGLSILSTRSPR